MSSDIAIRELRFAKFRRKLGKWAKRFVNWYYFKPGPFCGWDGPAARRCQSAESDIAIIERIWFGRWLADWLRFRAHAKAKKVSLLPLPERERGELKNAIREAQMYRAQFGDLTRLDTDL